MNRQERKMLDKVLAAKIAPRLVHNSESLGTLVTKEGKRRMKDRVLMYAADSNELQQISISEKRRRGLTPSKFQPVSSAFHVQYNNLALIAKHPIRERQALKN